MNKNRIRLTESQLHRVIKESVNKLLKEAQSSSIIEKIQQLVDQANEAYNYNINEYGGEYGLMDKDGNSYGLNGDIRLLKNGYLLIPFNGDRWIEYNSTEKIKVFTNVGGKIKFHKDEFHMSEDWRDGKRLLKKIINDAERFLKDMKGYDTNWEDSSNPNPQAIRDFNKSIGVRADARKPYNI